MTAPKLSNWADLLSAALVGTARQGGQPEELLDAAAAHALRRRAGVALVRGVQAPVPAPLDEAEMVGPAAAARASDLLALDTPTRSMGQAPRDMAGQLELLTEWLATAAQAGRRLPPELVPALLDAGRRHPQLRELISPAAGPLAGWLAGQRPEWKYLSSATPAVPDVANVDDVDDDGAWEFGSIGQRVAYLGRLRRRQPARARQLLAAAWDAEPPADRAALLGTFSTALSTADESLLERALDDRHRPVREVALGLLAGLPTSGYGQRMAARAAACVDLAGRHRITIHPPTRCDRAMRRDGIVARPPAGTGERTWWLEEILARTPLATWPQPREFLARQASPEWVNTLHRGLARAAAAQRDQVWAQALADLRAAAPATARRPDQRLLLEALYDALPADALASRAADALRRGLASAAAVGVEHALARCPRPWPPTVADSLFAALADHLTRPTTAWRLAGICELAALRLPASEAARATALADQLREAHPRHPGLAAIDRFAATLRYRHEMFEELK